MKSIPVQAGRLVEKYADVVESPCAPGIHHVGFFLRLFRARQLATIRKDEPRMEMTKDKPHLTMAEQIARAAAVFEEQRTGLAPRSVTVVQSDGTLVVTLHGALSPAEKVLAGTPAGALQVQEYHRQVFAAASDALRQEIKKITGVEVREATAEVELDTGTVVAVFTTGTVVQVYLLGQSITAAKWNGAKPVDST